MKSLMKKRSGKSGLPPGQLIHIGEERAGKARISVIDYTEAGVEERELADAAGCLSYRNPDTVTWINVVGVHDVEAVGAIGDCFGIHPLVLEDIVNTDQRPKIEDHDGYIFMVFKMIYHSGPDEEIVTEQVSLILGPGYVISFQESEKDVFDPVRERIKNGKGRIRREGSDYLAYALMDAVVDNYFIVLERTGEWIEDIEEELTDSPGEGTVREIHSIKRDMIYLRRSVWPLREITGAVSRGGSQLIRESTVIYFRDVQDHALQVADMIETYRDMLSGMIDLYLSSVSNRMNEVMKVLTIIATIFIPLTFIAGVYGMNFEFMPELKYRWAYPASLAVMAVVAGVMFVYFRKKRWI